MSTEPKPESRLNSSLFDSLLGSLFNAVPEGVLIVDKYSNIIYINQRMQEMWRTADDASSTEARNRAAELVQDPDWFERRSDEINSSELTIFDEIVALKDGRIFKRSSKPLIVERKKEGRIWTYQDVSQEYHARRLLESLIDNAPIGIAMAAENRKFVRANQAFAATLGYSKEQLVNTSFKDHIHPEDLADSLQILSQIDSGKAPRFHFEKRFIHKNGSIINAMVHIAHLPKYGDQDIRYIAQIVDLTQLKKAEQALFQSQKLESIGVLAGGIAHDFNNLLVAMTTQADVALRKSTLNQNPNENIEKIKFAAKNASYLTEQLLAYSGRRKFKVENINLNNEIEKSAGIFNLALPKNVVLKQNLLNDLPNITAEKSQIQQILLNLIINASESLEGRNGEVYIETQLILLTEEDDLTMKDYVLAPIETGAHVAVSVADSGIGMTEETIEKIFDPFFTTKFSGRGLGLAAVLGIIRSHRGGIKVISVLGKGTKFEIYFPVSLDEQNTTNGKVDFKDQTNLESKELENELSVLLIDDDENVRDALIDLFNYENIKLVCAANGAEGIQKLIENKDEVALALLDLSMPGLPSPETFSGLKKINPELPILLCSGFSEREISNAFNAEEIEGFISKPFNSNELINLVHTYTQPSRGQSAD
ncbi:MAG: PAS domain S-box protein [Chloroflexota bacterium]